MNKPSFATFATTSHPRDWVPRAWSGYYHRTIDSWEARGADAADVLRPWVTEPVTPQAIAATLADTDKITDETQLSAKLRQVRQRVMTALIARDLQGAADLNEVVTAVSALAEQTVSSALRFATHQLTETHGTARDAQGRPQDLLVVGMGKLGGGELNVSSDIDLIFVYPEDGQSDGRRPLDNREYFARLGRRIVGLIGEVNAHGFVFRVDTRLRPNGDSGPPMVSFAMLEEYLMVQGREWERYAWLKGRVVTPAVAMPQDAHQAAVAELDAIVQPFVFRRYLDFGAIRALRSLHAQIRAEAGKRDVRAQRRAVGEIVPVDVKLGRGGIREIEFIAQVFQMIRGGREPALRLRSTRGALQLLAQTGRITADDERMLQQSYDFLRRLEHRLQYREDAQTHRLPTQPDAFEAIAQTMGFADGDALLDQLVVITEQVAETFDRVFGDKASDGDDDDASFSKFPDPQAARERVEATRSAPRIATLPPAHRERLDRVLQRMIAVSAAHGDKALETLGRLLTLVEAIARRGAYLSLFDEYPATLQRVANMVAGSPWAAQYMTKHPLVLDELLDDRELNQRPDWLSFEQQLDQMLAAAKLPADRHGRVEPDVERQMDLLREQHHAQVFRLLAQDLAGMWTVERLADELSALADAMLRIALKHCWQTVPGRHRDDPAFAVIAYGKLGGKELGFASDLDLVFLHDDPSPDAADAYAKLTRRFSNWLTAMTSAGSLFEIDLRLRPNGNAGLVVIDFDGFARYQRSSAWVWEHQALTRARCCAGDPAIAARFEALRVELLQLPRDPAGLAAEVVTMRQKMLDGHPNPTQDFDLKHDRGGMVDLEFIVQYLVLAFSAQHSVLTGNIGNIALLAEGARLGLLPADLAQPCAAAYREYRRLQHTLRLQGQNKIRVPHAQVAEHRQAVLALWQSVFSEP